MASKQYDLIVIGAGSAGLSVSLFMNKIGLKVLLIDKTNRHIGGECLNDGCVPSKALIHLAKLAHYAKEAATIGLQVQGQVDLKKAMAYIRQQQNIIREHENAEYFRKEGLEVALGTAHFTGKHAVEVSGLCYTAKKIVIATGSKPVKLKVPGVEQVKYYDNENIFKAEHLPERLLVIGGGPIGMEIGQAFSRLGSKVTIVLKTGMILEHDDESVTEILLSQLKKEGITFMLNAEVERFLSAGHAVIMQREGSSMVAMDAVFVAVGRESPIDELQLEKAAIVVHDGKITVNSHLQTTNKDVYLCGDVSGGLLFSHAAEQQARLLLNNFFSPIKKRLKNDYMSWVTFTDPELATFGLQERALKERVKKYRRIETGFDSDDRAVMDNNRYGKLVLYISQGNFLHKEKILGGTMVAAGAGELIQELILANAAKIPINQIFNKIYPYPVASRVNQKAIIEYKEQGLTAAIKKLLRFAFRLMS